MGMDDVTSAKKAQEGLVNKLRKQMEEERAKSKAELESIEQQLIDAKMSLVMAQCEIQDLQTRLRK